VGGPEGQVELQDYGFSLGNPRAHIKGVATKSLTYLLALIVPNRVAESKVVSDLGVMSGQ